jgi:hypothetical protein
MTIPREFEKSVSRLPPGVRAVLEAELAAGNTIAHAGGGFPAPPAGECVKLAQPFKVATKKGFAVPAGVQVRLQPNHSLVTAEFGDDDKGWFWVIDTAPPYEERELPPMPPQGAHSETFEEATAQHRVATGRIIDDVLSKFAPSTVAPDAADFEVSVDFRGEQLTYREPGPGRSATMDWTWTNGYAVYADSLTTWKYDDGRSGKVSEKQKALILERVIAYARTAQGVTLQVR